MINKAILILLLSLSVFANSWSGGLPDDNYIVSVIKGMIHNANLIYSDTDTITIGTGYGECNGNFWEITANTNYDLTSLAAGEDLHYIYIDDSASSYPTPTFTDNTTEPVWSDSLQGWYNGNDRCIGQIYSPPSSATISHFTNVGTEIHFVEITNAQMASSMNPNGAWQTPDDHDGSFFFGPMVSHAKIYASCSDAAAPTSVAVTSVEVGNIQSNIAVGASIRTGSYQDANVVGLVPLGASKNIYIAAPDDDDNTLNCWVQGWNIER